MLTRSIPVAVFFTLVVGQTALAQAQPDRSEGLDTIVVTASRSPLDISAIGSATTVITREQIARRQSRFVADLLRTVPGFSVSNSGPAGSQIQVRVRGAEANHVLVLIDGVRANDPASGDEFRWELLSTSAVERIEIVRGPQSSLWGSDALAAVVHVITRSDAEDSSFGGYVEGGSDETINSGFHGSVGDGDWSLGFGLERLDTDGTNVARVGNEDDASDLTTASLMGQVRPNKYLTFDFSLRAVNAYSQFDPIDFFVTGLPTDGDSATESERIIAHAGAVLNTVDGRLLHRLTARYLDTNNENLTDGAQTSSTASDRLTLAYQADLGVGANLVSLAVEHEKTRFEQRGAIVFGDPNQNQESGITSLIADFQAKTGGNLTWLVSARYDDNDEFENALSGRLSLAYGFTDTTRIRLNIGRGQKSPTFTDRFGFFPGQFSGNPDLEPEKSTSVDIGIEQQLFGGALSTELTVFDQNLEDEIDGFVFDPATFLFTAENLTGESSRRGVETAARLMAAENLEFNASYTYTDSTAEDAAGRSVQELRRPRHSASLGAHYRFANQRASISVVADYGGNRADRFFPPFPLPPEIVTLGAHWLVDLAASYRVVGQTTVYVRVTNALDDEYEQVFGFRTPGRSAFVGIRTGFGQ